MSKGLGSREVIWEVILGSKSEELRRMRQKRKAKLLVYYGGCCYIDNGALVPPRCLSSVQMPPRIEV